MMVNRQVGNIDLRVNYLPISTELRFPPLCP